MSKLTLKQLRQELALNHLDEIPLIYRTLLVVGQEVRAAFNAQVETNELQRRLAIVEQLLDELKKEKSQ